MAWYALGANILAARRVFLRKIGNDSKAHFPRFPQPPLQNDEFGSENFLVIQAFVD